MAASTWTGNDYTTPGVSNLSMANPANWTGGTPVSSTTLDLIFHSGFAYTTTLNQNIANPLLLRSFDANLAYNFTFNGNTYRFANATNNTLNTGGNNTFNVGFDFQGPTAYTGGTTLTNLLSGSGSVTVTNSSLALNPIINNTYNGALTFNSSYFGVTTGSTTAYAGSSITLGAASNMNVLGANRFSGSPSITSTPTSVSGTNAYFDNAQTFGAITVNGSGTGISSMTLNGATLNGNVSVNGGQGNFYDNAATNLNANVSATNGALNLSSPNINLGGAARTFNTTNVGDTILTSQFSNGSLIKTGPGTLTLGYSTSTFNAPIDIQGGTVVSGPAQLGQGVTNNGHLTITYGPTNVVSGAITGGGSVDIQSNVVYAVPNSYTGGTTITTGSLEGSTSTLHGNITATGGSTLSINQPAGSGNFAAVFTGSGQVAKNGPGRVVIGGTNNYSIITNIYNGTLAIASDTAIGTGGLQIQANIEAVGSRTLSNALYGTLGFGNAGVVGSGNLTFTDAANKILNAGTTFTHSSTGVTTVPGKLVVNSGAALAVTAGTLSLGDPTAINGFVSQVGSTISVSSGGSLQLGAANFISLPDVTLNNGSLIVPNGYAIPLSAVLQGSGGVTGRVSSANGSTIQATGSLTIGDVAHPAGVNLDGELYTQKFSVTLNDLNQSVLGSLTNLGQGAGVPGTLNAARGMVVNFGRNITGNGTINSTNTLANAVIMNGDVNGDSISDYLNFTGYVKGVGTFNNAAFSGTYAPGLSPALVTVGSVIFTPSNVLDMEVGGLNRGSQHDGIDALANLALGGQLKISLINAYTPVLGNQFNLFDGPMTGTFASFNFAPLPAGLQWDTSLLYSQGIVQVAVPEPTMLAGLALGGLLLRRRR